MKSRNKDHKTHESIIGKIIYGFLLFMPLLAIGVTCAYAIFNKNAYQSYYGETINEEITINTNEIKSNREYTFNYLSTQQQNLIAQTRINVNNFNLVYTNLTSWQTNLNSIANKVNTIYFWVNTGANNQQNIQFYYTDENDTQQNTTISLYNSNSSFGYITFNFTPVNDITIVNENASNNISYIEYNSYSFVSEVFYYSIDKVQQSPLFNWAEDSAIYTGMTATCNALNITTPFIPLLMTYWLIISVIYILYDIILVILHIFHKKIHQLEDSF